MTQGDATIRLREGASERLKEMFGCSTDTEVAEKIGVDQSHYSRVLNGRSAAGPNFQGRLLLRAAKLGLKFDDLFDVVPVDARKSA